MHGVHGAMDLRHLRAFAAIVETGGFARAAAQLNVSQPALSRQIHALEAELGVPLFDRVGRRALLTSEGEDLLQRSRRLLSDVDSLGERARALKSGQSGLLRVGATPQVMETVLAGFLKGYRRRHPAVDVRLVEDGGVRLPARLDRGDIHLCLAGAGDARFHWRHLGPIHLLAVPPPAHRWSRRATLEIDEMVDVPLLLTRRDFGSRQWFDAACQVAHIRPQVLLESGAPATLIALAQAGYGIAIVPSNARIPGGLPAVPILLRGESIGVWASVSWDPRRFLAPYAQQFVEELVAYCRRAYPRPRLTRRAPPLPRPKEPLRDPT
jgi:LysR family transcriptional regulator, cyn operon transcriptional activator